MSSQTSTENDVQINNNTVSVTNYLGNTFVLDRNSAEVVADRTGILGTAIGQDGLDRVFNSRDVENADASRTLHDSDRVRFEFTFEDGSELVVGQV